MTAPGSFDRCFTTLVGVAIRGERCPMNGYFGVTSHLIGALARAGFIKVEIYANNWRVVTILRGQHAGKKTAAPQVGNPYKIIDSNGISKTFWTDKRVKQLRRRCARNERAAIIARALGCTRNMIIGKCRRLGIRVPKKERRKRLSIGAREGWAALSPEKRLKRIEAQVEGCRRWQAARQREAA